MDTGYSSRKSRDLHTSFAIDEEGSAGGARAAQSKRGSFAEAHDATALAEVVAGEASFNNIAKSGIFADEVLDSLEESTQVTLLQSLQGQLFQISIFILCAIMGSLCPIATQWTKEYPEQYKSDDGWVSCGCAFNAEGKYQCPDTLQGDALKFCMKQNFQYHAPVQLMTESAVSFVIAVCMTQLTSGETGMNAAFDVQRIKAYAPISILYAIGDLAQLFAIGSAGAAFYIVMSQLKLVGTALMTRVFLGKAQSLLQWLILVAVTIICILFCFMDLEKQGKKGSDSSIEVDFAFIFATSLIIMKVVISAVNSVLLEKTMKAAPNENIWTNQVQLKIVSVPFSLIFVIIKGFIVCGHDPSGKDGRCIQDTGIFWGFGLKIMILVLVQTVQNVVVGTVYKKLNAISNYLSRVQSLWITYFLSVMMEGKQLHFDLILVVFLMLIIVFAYSLAKPESPKKAVEAPTVESPASLPSPFKGNVELAPR